VLGYICEKVLWIVLGFFGLLLVRGHLPRLADRFFLALSRLIARGTPEADAEEWLARADEYLDVLHEEFADARQSPEVAAALIIESAIGGIPDALRWRHSRTAIVRKLNGPRNTEKVRQREIVILTFFRKFGAALLAVAGALAAYIASADSRTDAFSWLLLGSIAYLAGIMVLCRTWRNRTLAVETFVLLVVVQYPALMPPGDFASSALTIGLGTLIGANIILLDIKASSSGHPATSTATSAGSDPPRQ
jgi:hypothetical protein